MQEVYKLISKINEYIVNPIILVIFAIALLFFVFGVFEYLWKSHKDPAAIQKGAKHIGWGLLGMFIMVSVFGIIQIIMNTIPVDPKARDAVKQVIPLNN